MHKIINYDMFLDLKLSNVKKHICNGWKVVRKDKFFITYKNQQLNYSVENFK